MRRTAPRRSADVPSADGSGGELIEAERRRELHRVLGDPTRANLMRVLSSSSQPRTAADLAHELGLHPNTIRPHLERLRAVDLVRREVVRHGDVGRPQHQYSAAPDPGLTGMPSDVDALSLLAGAMVTMVRDAGVGADAARSSGAATGVALAATPTSTGCRTGSVDRIASDLDRLGFQPVVHSHPGDGPTEIVFGRCPFGSLVDEAPDIVCSIHEGLLDGFAQGEGAAEIVEFVGPSDGADCKVIIVDATNLDPNQDDVNNVNNIEPQPESLGSPKDMTRSTP